jgi:hypothetical protein
LPLLTKIFPEAHPGAARRQNPAKPQNPARRQNPAKPENPAHRQNPAKLRNHKVNGARYETPTANG